MSKKANDFKKASRILSSIIRAIESCFADPKIDSYKIAYEDGIYELELNAELFDGAKLSFSRKNDENESVEVLLKDLIDGFAGDVVKAIEDLEKVDEYDEYEDKYLSHHKTPLIESQAVNLTTLQMFQCVIGSIKI